LDSADVLGGFGRGPVGGAAFGSPFPEYSLFAESSVEHFAAISPGSNSVHLALSLISLSELAL
jgi:hypothetical protein